MSLHNKTIDELTQIVANHVSVSDVHLPDEYFYKSLPLSIIDAVFSIGVTYASTANTVRRFCENQIVPWARFRNEHGNEKTIEDFLLAVKQVSVVDLAANIYRNRQRTSSKNGILKADAVNRWANVLLKYGVNSFNEARSLIGNSLLENELRSLPGQSSGISFKYFKMLVGDETEIKADRHILRFMEDVGINDVAILKDIAANMHVTPRLLDYAIWQKLSRRVAQSQL
jgi:hypothetical protein